jgi:predicted aspartyl protease
MSEEIEKVVKAQEEIVKTSIALARSVWERAKIEALKQGLTLAQVIEAALKKYLELSEEEKK